MSFGPDALLFSVTVVTGPWNQQTANVFVLKYSKEKEENAVKHKSLSEKNVVRVV